MRHNESNPKCPECNGHSKKAGFLITRTGRKQKYQCNVCGRTWTQKNE